MRVGIDLSVTNISQAGTTVYARNLAEALGSSLDADSTLHVFAVGQHRDMATRKTLRSRAETVYRDLVWTHLILPCLALREKVDVLHMPANVIPVFSPCPTVVTIHDTTVLQAPNRFTFWHRTYSRIFVPLSAKRASKVLADSEHSKRDIVRLFGVSPRKVEVVYLGASPEFRQILENEVAVVKRKYDLASFILTVGTLEPRKNVERLLQAFAVLRARESSYQLVHAGPRGWLFNDIMKEVERLGLQSTVRFLGGVPLEDLVGLYNAASVFVYPSLYEGFGLPVLEAMTCGCPVITSNVSSLPEVAGGAGILVDPYDVRQIAEAIREVLEDETRAQAMRQRGLERAKLFSWEQCAQETLSVYQQVLDL